jgi:hypothetical protein
MYIYMAQAARRAHTAMKWPCRGYYMYLIMT